MAHCLTDVKRRLKLLRCSKKLSRTQIARKLGISERTYERYEQEGSSTSIPLDILVELANLYNVTLDHIVLGKPNVQNGCTKMLPPKKAEMFEKITTYAWELAQM